MVLWFSLWLCVPNTRTCHPCMSAFCQQVSRAPKVCRKQEAPSARGQPSDSSGDDRPAVRPHPPWWGLCPGQLPPLPPLPQLALWSRAGLDFVLSPLEVAWPDSIGAKFLFIFPGFFGVGRLRNVECCNVGKGGGETGASSPAPLILLSPVLWKLQPPLGPLVPFPSPSQ